MNRLDTWATSAALIALILIGSAAAHAQFGLRGHFGLTVTPADLRTFALRWYLGYGAVPGSTAVNSTPQSGGRGSRRANAAGSAGASPDRPATARVAGL